MKLALSFSHSWILSKPLQICPSGFQKTPEPQFLGMFSYVPVVKCQYPNKKANVPPQRGDCTTDDSMVPLLDCHAEISSERHNGVW